MGTYMHICTKVAAKLAIKLHRRQSASFCRTFVEFNRRLSVVWAVFTEKTSTANSLFLTHYLNFFPSLSAINLIDWSLTTMSSRKSRYTFLSKLPRKKLHDKFTSNKQTGSFSSALRTTSHPTSGTSGQSFLCDDSTKPNISRMFGTTDPDTGMFPSGWCPC